MVVVALARAMNALLLVDPVSIAGRLSQDLMQDLRARLLQPGALPDLRD